MTGYQSFHLFHQSLKLLHHGNSTPENGFSINKYMLQYTITIEALRFMKGTIFSFGVTLSIPIMKVLLESSKLAYSYYNADIEVKFYLQKKGEETNKTREAEPQKKKDYKDDRNSLISSI